MNAYFEALLAAYNAGYYVPDLDVYYHRYDDFRHPVLTQAYSFH